MPTGGACGKKKGKCCTLYHGTTCVKKRCQCGQNPDDLPFVACGGKCLHIANDPANCGACGTVCTGDQQRLGTCLVPGYVNQNSWSITRPDEVNPGSGWAQDVACDGAGHVYVADPQGGHSTIKKYTTAGEFVLSWGGLGSGDGQFVYPWSVAVDASGHVYVADDANSRVQKFTADGTFVTKWGSEGTGNGQFSRTDAVAVDGSGNVFVSDHNTDRVQVFTSDGTFVRVWGSTGSGNGQFRGVRDLTVGADGNVYVVDGNGRVQVFASDGTFVRAFGSVGIGTGQFYQQPWRIAAHPSGRIFVSDDIRCQVFSATGTFETAFNARYPGAFDEHGTLYAGVWGAVNVFVPAGSASAAASGGRHAVAPAHATGHGREHPAGKRKQPDMPRIPAP